MMNRYFILPYPNLNSALWAIIVERPETLRTNLQGNFCVVKLYSGDEENHASLNGFTEYTHEEILEYLDNNASEWNEPI
jgi:hypothetical protein